MAHRNDMAVPSLTHSAQVVIPHDSGDPILAPGANDQLSVMNLDPAGYRENLFDFHEDRCQSDATPPRDTQGIEPSSVLISAATDAQTVSQLPSSRRS